MLSEISYAIKRFNTLAGYDLNFFEKEILGYAYFANGEIHIEENLLGQPYVWIKTKSFNFSARIRADYRGGLVFLIKKGFVENWYENNFILTKQGWDRSKKIVNETKRTIPGYYSEIE